MYSKADGNAALARRLYQKRYPQRQCPDRKTFVRLHYRLCEYGKFNSPGLGRGRPGSTTPEVQEEILEAVNMTLLSAHEALQVNVPHTTVWRLLKEDQLLAEQAYTNFLENTIPHVLEDTPLINRQHIHFLHDGAPAHFSRTARRYLNRRFPDRWIGRGGPIAWPPRSPDLNPLDFYLWGHLKTLVYSSPVPDLESFRNRIVACSEDIRNTPGVWDRFRRSMRHRCEYDPLEIQFQCNWMQMAMYPIQGVAEREYQDHEFATARIPALSTTCFLHPCPESQSGAAPLNHGATNESETDSADENDIVLVTENSSIENEDETPDNKRRKKEHSEQTSKQTKSSSQETRDRLNVISPHGITEIHNSQPMIQDTGAAPSEDEGGSLLLNRIAFKILDYKH
ncbi:hypothetical protein ANN_08796 [Periplaneta americana]|uniref:DUF4817 domain-containing protein n=1 Tax=Periplaneta americana TaxID=6978 RepID=A0ABQ8T2F3_PERAM|nr:hypothetical protein ANN_08796 [Periplaneta americana]